VGIKLEPLKGQKTSDKEKLFDLQRLAVGYYHYVLTKLAEGDVARKYFEKRGIKQETILNFKLGFAPYRYESLSKFLKEKHKYQNKDLVDSGLAIETSKGVLDRFRGRVILPIFDHRGNAVALAGRILPEFDNGKTGKYINSPESDIYHKSRSVYGLNVSRSQIKRANRVVVVEGPLDAISSFQSGIQNVIAIQGSAMTEEQVTLLSRYAKTFVFALDSDFAGNNAAMRAITQAQLKGVDILVADMDPYKDPDEFAQNDPGGYKKALDNAIGVWDFMINLALERHDKTTGSGKAAISRELTPVLASIPDQIVRSHYIGLLAQKLGVPTEAVSQQVSKSSSAFAVAEKEFDESTEQNKTRREILEEKTLSLSFINNPAKLIDEKLLGMLSVPILKKIAEFYINKKSDKSKFEAKNFLGKLPSELKDRFSELLLQDDFDNGEFKKEYEMSRYELELIYTKEKLNELARLISEYEEKNQEQKLAQTQQEFSNLSKRLAQLQELEI